MNENDLSIQLDFRSGIPIYIQIVNQIEAMITIGKLQPGEQLPTVRQLATDLRVNFNTVARAYRMLDEAGLISTQHGRGTYVWERPAPEKAEKLRQQELDELARRYVISAARLSYSPEEAGSAVEREILLWKAGKLPNVEAHHDLRPAEKNNHDIPD